MRYLLDTDTCIEILRSNRRVRDRLQSENPDDWLISVVSVFEPFAGVERCRRPKEERRKVEAFLAPLHLLPFDLDAALRASKIRWHLEKSGKPIGPFDLLLAAQALSLDIALVTGNCGEFARVPDLRLENWTADP